MVHSDQEGICLLWVSNIEGVTNFIHFIQFSLICMPVSYGGGGHIVPVAILEAFRPLMSIGQIAGVQGPKTLQIGEFLALKIFQIGEF